MNDGVQHAADLAVGMADDTLTHLQNEGHILVQDGSESIVNRDVAGVFLTGLELGVRLGVATDFEAAKRFLAKLVRGGSGPPLEIREQHMKEDIAQMLQIAIIKDGVCPDCGGKVVYDEDEWCLLCEGCGQFLQEPREDTP